MKAHYGSQRLIAVCWIKCGLHVEARKDLYISHPTSNLYLKLTVWGKNFKLFLPAGMKH